MSEIRPCAPGQHYVRDLAEKLWVLADPVPLQFVHQLVILPSLRASRQLRFLLLETARKRGTSALLLPQMVNLSRLVDQLPLPPGRVPVTHPRRLLRLAALVERSDSVSQLLGRPGFVSPLTVAKYLLEAFDDVCRHATILKKRLEPGGTSELDVGWLGDLGSALLTERLEAVLGIQKAYLDELHAEGLEDPVMHQEMRFITAASSPALATFLDSFRHIHVAGFEDATLGAEVLLAAVADARRESDTCHIQVWPTDLDAWKGTGIQQRSQDVSRHSRDPLYAPARMQRVFKAVEARVDPRTAIARQCLFPCVHRRSRGAHGPSRPDQHASAALALLHRVQQYPVVEAEDPFHEATLVAARARSCIEDGRSVLVVATDRDFGEMILQMLRLWGIEADGTWGHPVTHTRTWRMVLFFRDLLVSGEHYRDLAMLLRDPHFEGVTPGKGGALAWQLEREIVPREGVTRGISRLMNACRTRQERLRSSGEDSDTGNVVIRADYSELMTTLERLDHRLEPLRNRGQGTSPTRHQAAAWIQALDSAVTRPDPSGRSGDDAVMETLRMLSEVPEDLAQGISQEQFLQLLDGLVGGMTWQESRNRETAVLVADPGEARHLLRDVTFLTGLVDDWFPGGEPESTLIPNDVRPMLGMPAMTYVEGLRAGLFLRTLLSDDRVYLSCHRNQGSTPVIASRFLQRMLGLATVHGIPRERLVSSVPFQYPLPPASSALDAASLRLNALPRPWVDSARIRRTLSASDLEQYLQCPYRYYCGRILNLEPEEEVEEILTAQDFGTLIHRVMRAFWDPDRRGIPGLPGPFSGDTSSETSQAEELLRAITDAESACVPPGDLDGQRSVRRFRRMIPDIIAAEQQRWEEGWRPHLFEHEFLYSPGSGPVSFQCRVDRVDLHRDGIHLAVLDYKTGHSPGDKELAQGTRPQLFLYALAAANELDRKALQLAYYNLKPSKSSPVGTSSLYSKGELSASVERRLELLPQYEALFRQVAVALGCGAFVDFPAIAGATCRFCSYAGVCRKTEVHSEAE